MLKRIEDYELRGDTLHEDQLGGKEETVLRRDAIPKIQALMTRHLHWHPFKFPSTMPPTDNGASITSRYVWLRQATEMHNLCQTLNEGYAWEYLWMNWYRLDKWKLWARATTLEYYPIVQTNAPVEVHWHYLKNRVLHYFSRPRLDRLCFEIHTTALSLLANRINQYRNGAIDCSWHRKMVSEWKRLDDKIDAQDEADLADEEAMSIEPDDEGHPAKQRQTRMETMHHTDIANWNCHCSSFNHSPYHICAHLLRLYGQPYPVKQESLRQHRPPLLFIESFHTPDQKVVCVPSEVIHEINPPASIEQLDLSQKYLEELVARYGATGDGENDREDYSRVKEDKQKYGAWITALRRAADYAEAEMNYGDERFRRLPDCDAKSIRKLMKLAGHAHILDHGRKRRPTWCPERAGGNMYRS